MCGAGCWLSYLEESLGFGDHVGQALGGSQVLTQVPLIRAAQAILPVTRPTATTQEQLYLTFQLSYSQSNWLFIPKYLRAIKNEKNIYLWIIKEPAADRKQEEDEKHDPSASWCRCYMCQAADRNQQHCDSCCSWQIQVILKSFHACWGFLKTDRITVSCFPWFYLVWCFILCCFSLWWISKRKGCGRFVSNSADCFKRSKTGRWDTKTNCAGSTCS